MKPTSTRDYVVLFFIVLMSLAASAVLGTWQIRGLVHERGPSFLYRPSPRYTYWGEAVWHGQFWYSESLHIESGIPKKCRVHRRNLETGEAHATSLLLKDSGVWIVAAEDRLWVIGTSNIYETDGQSVLGTFPVMPAGVAVPSGNRPLLCNYFMLDGVLSSIREHEPERYRMMQLIDGEWLDGREVILPGLNRQWKDNEYSQRKELLPRTCESLFPPWMTPTSMLDLRVIPDHGTVHLVAFDPFRSFMAYRAGFEFLDAEAEDGPASVFRPANAPPEASGWEYVAEKGIAPLFSATVVRGSPVIVARLDILDTGYPQRGPCRTWIRAARSRFDVLGDVPVGLQEWPILISSQNHDVGYLLSQNEMQGAKVFAVEETGLRRLPHDLPGSEWPMIGWWARLGAAITASWLTHTGLLVIGMGWFLPHQNLEIASGHCSAPLGPVPRRAMARGIDLTLILLPIIFHVAWLASAADPVVVTRELVQLESQARGSLNNNWQGNYNMLIRGNSRKVIAAYVALQWSLLGSMAVWFTLVAVEGACGATPGKWLCGLRTMRTTLRPCGFLRAVVRDVLLCVDVPLLMTPIPAAIACVSSPHRQRLGDRVTDTVVVEAASFRTRSPQPAVAVPSM